MNNTNLELALKDPSNLSSAELDDVLAAQLETVHTLRQFLEPQAVEKKPKSGIKGRRSSLKNINNRI